MLKLRRRSNGWQAWAMLTVFAFAATSFCFWALTTHPILALSIILPLATLTIVDVQRRKRKLQALAEGRDGESICEFAKSFDARAVDTWVIRAVYEQLQNYLAPDHPGFPLRASDQLLPPLIADPDDLDMDLASEVAERTGRSLDAQEANPYFGKVVTVADMVMFFNAQPFKTDSACRDQVAG